MSAPRKIWLQYSFDMLDKHDDQPFPGSTAYHHDDVVRELRRAVLMAAYHDGRDGEVAVDAFDAALAKIAQEG